MPTTGPIAGPEQQKKPSYPIWIMTTMVLGAMYTPIAHGSKIDTLELARLSLQQACTTPFAADAVAAALRAQAPAPSEAITARGQQLGERTSFLTQSHRIVIERMTRNNRQAGVRIFIHDQTNKPLLFVTADAKCQIRIARRVEYDEQGHAQDLQTLDAELQPDGPAEPLDPPVPDGTDAGRVRIGLVDAGVNYLLPHIHTKLARDEHGKLIGFDYWDMDPRPFDSHPIPSLFFTQRHGTRTASLLLQEAPDIALAPYRYPRPDMSRMRQLVDHAHRMGVRIIGLPLGGNHEAEWRAFAQAAKAHPSILFVASAGNAGRDIDQTPVYPAVLDLANLLVVTSADDHIGPADRTNWGARSVDLLVPAERMETIDFNGQPRAVSGSSYAVSRIVALAARLAAQHKNWQAAELKRAILDRALPLPHLETIVSAGYLPDPLLQADDIARLSQHKLPTPMRSSNVAMELNVVWLQDSGWQRSKIEDMVRHADLILSQCGVRFTRVILHKIQVEPRLLDFDVHTAHTLVNELKIGKPTIYLTRDTKRQDGFEGEAFGKGNSMHRPWLMHTVWLVADIHQPALALAHELVHVISNDGSHAKEDENLMNTRTSPTATKLNQAQCKAFRDNGLAEKLLFVSGR